MLRTVSHQWQNETSGPLADKNAETNLCPVMRRDMCGEYLRVYVLRPSNQFKDPVSCKRAQLKEILHDDTGIHQGLTVRIRVNRLRVSGLVTVE